MSARQTVDAIHAAFPEELRDACGVGLLADPTGRSRRRVLPRALFALGRLSHRGAVDADGRTGDGAGVMTEIPWAVLRADLETLGLSSPPRDPVALGLLFLPSDEKRQDCARRIVATTLAAHGLTLVGWREVPVDESALGAKAAACRPHIVHAVVTCSATITADDFERRLAEARRESEDRAASYGLTELAIASLSHRTLVYKALVRSVDLAAFYPDLRHPDYETSFALFHQRFSTNTLPSWSMTQPFRLLAHNGEINTITGNRSWMGARSCGLPSGTSDSASLDEALSRITGGGRSLAHGMTMLMPPAWENDVSLAPPVRAFFEYQSALMEPWDGPALVVFSDGRIAGAALDRNGLRPARYSLLADGMILLASEAGVLDIDDADVLFRGSLRPGAMLTIDLETGALLDQRTIVRELAARSPYAEWLEEQRVTLGELDAVSDPLPSPPTVPTLRAFGMTHDELQWILGPMARTGTEPLGSMGDDTPLAVLSSRPRMLFSYFKQRFAQVTNPPIDPLRESLVMSLDARLGAHGRLANGPLPGPFVSLASPLLDTSELARLCSSHSKGWSTRTFSLLFFAAGGPAALEGALDELLLATADAARDGTPCIVLSDRGVDETNASIPSLLAVSAVHQHLIREGLRPSTSLVADTGEARDEHHLATLLGFGADAVCPWLAFDLVVATESDEALARYRAALGKGLRKILSKMGVSTLRSYRGAQLFEAVGIDDELIERHFTGTPSFIGGIGLREIALEVLGRHQSAHATPAHALEDAGLFRYRQHGEAHAYAPQVVKALHKAVTSRQLLDYKSYADLVHAREPLAIRDLLEFRAGPTVPLDEVEPASAIVRRFMTAAMSLGALSPEAQQVLAVAMNRLGARSNSGEGGEPAEALGTVTSNRIKQIASGRFGVSAEYLMSADELQIKIAQGSKPGEGGQLPGGKVTPLIARVRHAAPGTTLISPPPHHDIYSIEDLAQLVYDLKRVNPAATVSVKLVSSAGIGTIAVGVAKAYADAIEISGHDGGTGASPLGSVKNAGTPWELGLSEAQQALIRGGLRGRVRLQVNGGLKTGRDVVMAALLGAEEFGFGTAALVAAGCVMARQCHLNTCPAGIATQREDLRAKFNAKPEDVIAFFTAIAGEVREILAMLGARALEDIIGRTELLEARIPSNGKASTVRLDRLLAVPPMGAQRRCTQRRNDPPQTGSHLDEAILQRLRVTSAAEMSFGITNADRSAGARLAGERTIHRSAFPENLVIVFRGTAGQSFGAFCVDGLRLVLEGEANDYVGKGMSGGEIIVRPRTAIDRPWEQVIAGNTLLYGATGGRAFIAGRAGERFAVRNSGALAVVEGTGDHACEYMTAGAVIILGTTGRNAGAGMSGGVLFALDHGGLVGRRVHHDSVRIEETLGQDEERWLHDAITLHLEATNSARAAWLLSNWPAQRQHFRRITSAAGGLAAQPLPSLHEPRIARTAAC